MRAAQNISVAFGLVSLFSLSAFAATVNSPARFSGAFAFDSTRQAVAFGARPSGSKAISAERAWILSQIHKTSAQISTDAFTASTPDGPVPMVNVIARFPGSSGRAIAITGHYDTKKIEGISFVGANDGGSSTGFLLQLARLAASMPHRDDWYLVFLDGEEAVRNWSDTDSCYGSRHLAAQWLANGTLKRLKALINVDMIGDRQLAILNDQNSSAALRSQVQQIAARLNYTAYLDGDTAMDDDHRPFAELGANVIDLIDFDYGPQNSYWHSAADTMDKLSPHSFQVVGDITLELLKQLD